MRHALATHRLKEGPVTDQSLRDALEKLCDRYDRIAEEVSVRGGVKASYDIPGSEIRYLLADHPAEPVGVSDEPACDCYRRVPPEKHTSGCTWGRWHLMKEAGLLAERSVGVSDEAVEAARIQVAYDALHEATCVNHGEWCRESEPQLKDAIRVMLWRLDEAKPLMGATPRPTRDQVAAVWREHTWISDESRCSCGDREIEFMSHHVADAVLALMGGAK